MSQPRKFPDWQQVTPEHVRAARSLMRGQMDLSEIAELLNVSKSELDWALWRYIDNSFGHSQPRPMF